MISSRSSVTPHAPLSIRLDLEGCLTCYEVSYLVGNTLLPGDQLTKSIYPTLLAPRARSRYDGHVALGHASREELLLAFGEGFLDGFLANFPLDSLYSLRDCLLDRPVRIPSSINSPPTVTAVVLLIHMHISGPLLDGLLCTQPYFVSFTDDFSRYIFAYYMPVDSPSQYPSRFLPSFFYPSLHSFGTPARRHPIDPLCYIQGDYSCSSQMLSFRLRLSRCHRLITTVSLRLRRPFRLLKRLALLLQDDSSGLQHAHYLFLSSRRRSRQAATVATAYRPLRPR